MYKGKIYSFSHHNVLYFKIKERTNLATIEYNRMLTEKFISTQNGPFHFIVDVSEWDVPLSEITDQMKSNQQADFDRGRENLYLVVGERKIFSDILIEVFIGNNNGRRSIQVVKSFDEAINDLKGKDLDVEDLERLYEDYQNTLKSDQLKNNYMILPI